jgi:hypothetical protein
MNIDAFHHFIRWSYLLPLVGVRGINVDFMPSSNQLLGNIINVPLSTPHHMGIKIHVHLRKLHS